MTTRFAKHVLALERTSHRPPHNHINMQCSPKGACAIQNIISLALRSFISLSLSTLFVCQIPNNSVSPCGAFLSVVDWWLDDLTGTRAITEHSTIHLCFFSPAVFLLPEGVVYSNFAQITNKITRNISLQLDYACQL